MKVFLLLALLVACDIEKVLTPSQKKYLEQLPVEGRAYIEGCLNDYYFYRCVEKYNENNEKKPCVVAPSNTQGNVAGQVAGGIVAGKVVSGLLLGK